MSELAPAAMFHPRVGLRRALGRLFAGVCLLLCLAALATLFVLLGQVFAVGWPHVSAAFLSRPPSNTFPELAGIHSALWGTIWLLVLTTLVSVPIGVSAAIYLNEYARDTRLTRFIHLNISNLAGVPSVVYGMLGLAIFVRFLLLDRSVLSGALTLSLLVLPAIIIVSREALAAVPDSIRQAAFALGATRWQTVRHHVLPAAVPGIMTGLILALSRAIGEAAPLIVVGSAAYLRTAPGGSISEYAPGPWRVFEYVGSALDSRFSAMPIQVYLWSSHSQPAFHDLAAAGIIVLLGILLSINAVAIGIRAWQQKHRMW